MSPTGKRINSTLLRSLRWAAILLAAMVTISLIPLIHIIPLDEARRKAASATFDAKAFAEDFWNNRLLISMHKAADISHLFTIYKEDNLKAQKRYGHTVGIGATHYYFVTGTGWAVSVNPDFVSLSLSPGDSVVDVVIETAIIVGNTIRNGTGLLDVNDFPNSQDFNHLSIELNRIVEARVLPPFLEKVHVGAEVLFTGCAEITDERTQLHPMHIIPIILEIQ